ncbi:MAG TPA: endonuclease/exonuclease/phosphatase family protein [Casimicrobiaceae bacterium]|nr:endonuclease/exonuclease/phosphatase family protein [Casimicrobiaceae bacterium]
MMRCATGGVMRTVRVAAALAALAAMPGCVTLTVEPRALLLDSSGNVDVQTLACDGPAFAAREASGRAAAEAVDPLAIRIVTWNIHKQDDAGWQEDLARFVADDDIVLLQEAVLEPRLRSVFERGGLRWVMASSFIYSSIDIGVVTGSRKVPLTSCTQRVTEPLIRIPKSGIITWFRLAGRDETLAVVNVHAINFALTLGGYRAQLEALGAALGHHPGPIVFAGDLNTWTDARDDAMRAVAARLGMTEIVFKEDRRTLFMGKQLDHIYVRGLDVIAADAIPVKSSDHNPVRATLRVAQAPRASHAAP